MATKMKRLRLCETQNPHTNHENWPRDGRHCVTNKQTVTFIGQFSKWQTVQRD